MSKRSIDPDQSANSNQPLQPRQAQTSEPVLITPQLFCNILTGRDPEGHKGTFGSVGILGGAPGMTGAALLAGRSALKAGAGRVYVSLAQHRPDVVVDYVQPELMIRPAREMLANARQINAWGVGCGMGSSADSVSLFRELLHVRAATPTVIDADALNALANATVEPDWSDDNIVLTPHPAEAARLLHTTTDEVQARRLSAALRISGQYRAWVVLKGHRTLIASPDGRLYINPTGNVALATAGTGDVLTGLIASLLAQGYDVATAVCGAVWLHGAAGEAMTSKLGGPIGVTASDIVDSVRTLRNSSSDLEQEIALYGISHQIPGRA